MRLIDADALAKKAYEVAYPVIHGWNDHERGLTLAGIAQLLDEAPTIDAVPVVRCADCPVPHNRWTGCPKLGGLVTPPEFYCAFGEREDGDA